MMTKNHLTGTAKCDARTHNSYEAAQMALYIMGQRNLRDNLGRRLDTSKLEIKKCAACRGWHVRRAK